jgi:ribosomal protein S12 methylthiotransferase
MNLLKLIEKMEKSLSDVRVRCLYMHPSGIDDDLLHGIADSSVVVPYLDMPIQHIDNSLLSAMRRGTSEKYLRKLIEKIRKIIPECTIRTTVLAGFPGETAEQFGKLRDFIAETCFDRLGVFAFSSEEGTKAHSMHGKINKNTAQKRAAEIMEIQKSISLRKNMALLGKKIKVLVDGKQGKSVTGRMISQAPEVDGCVYMRNCPETMIGNFAQVKLIRAFPYDLEGIIQA